ncbi:MAG: HAMP domain-containing histidine kinase [Planctomycetes bacterium]|nr:HAMP domain-containing histidine kinase [Planctomycetota bacterium]
MATYTLSFPDRASPSAHAAPRALAHDLPEELLLRNALWFCRLRWLVIGLFAAFGVLGLVPGLLPRLGLRPPGAWPLVAAAVLFAANLAWLAHAHTIAAKGRHAPFRGERWNVPLFQPVCMNLWAQIVADLVSLTLVVHHVGSLETFIAFAYLFHIVLSCIFFPRRWSLVVTALACALYLGTVALEEAGVLERAGIYADASLRELMDHLPGVRLAHVAWAPFTWFVVWYLAAHLSAEVHSRDRELAETNRLLLAAQEERRQHMLRTTHELKAPFSAIHANVQLLTKGHCGQLPAEAQAVLGRITTRCRRLAAEIQEMLQLANLHSVTQEPLPTAQLDLAAIMRWSLARVAPMAQERQIALDADLHPAPVWAVEDHAKMVFANLLSNAITYSHPGGHVRVEVAPQHGGSASVVVQDHGIGIEPAKLPRIFEPYYRAEEAVRHNRESTGLGLAIVRQAAEADGLTVHVESEPNVGTRFTVLFPPSPPRSPGLGKGDTPPSAVDGALSPFPSPALRRKENADGVLADRG